MVSIVYRIIHEHRLIVSVHVGTVPDEEFLRFYRQLLGDAEFNEKYNLLVDLRRATSGERSTEALRSLSSVVAERYRLVEPAPKTAVIAPTDISFGLGRMYQSFVHTVPGEVVIFRAADAALAWLGIPPEVLDIDA
jgi:hypothetical protein